MKLFKPVLTSLQECGLFLLLVLSVQSETNAFEWAQGTDGVVQSTTDDPKTTTKPCISGGQVAVIFSDMSVSKFLIWPAAILLITGIIQILIALFVFMSEALDIYMLLINYCIATLFCIFTILFTGSGLFTITQKTCVYLSPLSCIAISVPMMSLFLLSYSRFYAITYPFYYVDRFTVKKQIIVCLLSWIIPIAVVGVGSATLCTSISLHYNTVFTGFCLYPSKPINIYSYKQYEDGKTYQEWENFMTPFPVNINCQVYMCLYVVTCLILPLIGCIICYSCIVYQLDIIKKNRENLTNTSSTGPGNTNSVTFNEEQVPKEVKRFEKDRKSFSVKSLKFHLKKQTSVISQKAKEKIPVSVIVILTLYVLVAVPLTLVEIFNTNLVEAEKTMVWINLDAENLAKLSSKEAFRWCDKAGTTAPDKDIKALLLDIAYSVGIISLGLSPWAYIKFTRSFEENLWLIPLRKASGRIGLEIRKSVKVKKDHHKTQVTNVPTVGNSALSMKPRPNVPNTQRSAPTSSAKAGYRSSVTDGTTPRVSLSAGNNVPTVSLSTVPEGPRCSTTPQGTVPTVSLSTVPKSPRCSTNSEGTVPAVNRSIVPKTSRRRCRGRPDPTCTESSNQAGKDIQGGVTTQSETDNNVQGGINTQSETTTICDI